MSGSSEPWWTKGGGRRLSLDGTTLNADFPGGPSGRKRSSIDLDKYVTVTKDGELRWVSKEDAQGGKWGKDAYLGTDWKDGPVLKEMVRNEEGVYTRTELPLGDRIKYENGELVFEKQEAEKQAAQNQP